MTAKKNYDPTLKAKVALEAIKGQKGTAKFAANIKIPATNLHDWQDKALNMLHQIFISESEYNKRQKLLRQEIEGLHKIIEELTIENNYLKKNY